ncbi:Sesquiterpene synthase [Hibiscus syriacus]|uniref:Sesquiterpene synthase n=1 Tax=Hibiscus syriacus TaxID=106335 RepID=A0A6A2YJZ8_HIBSY|nr:Sesquiterpene synthase [Hibiscus syriacus]
MELPMDAGVWRHNPDPTGLMDLRIPLGRPMAPRYILRLAPFAVCLGLKELYQYSYQHQSGSSSGVTCRFKQLSESYFAEVKWYHENYVPTMEEYMRVAIISIGVTVLTITSLVGMGDLLAPDIFNWASKHPKIIDVCSIYGRLFNDIVSDKFEQERGHPASAVECYMRQHGVSEEEACIELKKQVDNVWKDINHEMIFSETSKAVPMPVLTRVLNLVRGTEFMYKAGDWHTHVGKTTKDGIDSLLIDPISVTASES